LKACAYQYDGGWGRILAPPPGEIAGSRGDRGWVLPVALLDACVVACGSFVYLQFGGRLEVPHGFKRLALYRQPREAESCTLRLRYRGHQERHGFFDFTLYGEDRTVILEAEGYRTVFVAEKTR
jgi:hypothetical protein